MSEHTQSADREPQDLFEAFGYHTHMDRQDVIIAALVAGVPIIANPISDIIIREIIGEGTIIRLTYQVIDVVGMVMEMTVTGGVISLIGSAGTIITILIVKGNAGWIIGMIRHEKYIETG